MNELRLRPIVRALRGSLRTDPAVMVVCRDPLEPWEGREVIEIFEEEPLIFALARRGLDLSNEPVMLSVNGAWYARREWGGIEIQRGDIVTLRWLAAGSGSNPARVIVGIVLIVIGAILMYTGYGAALGKYMVVMGASMLISEALAKKPILPSTDAANALSNASPTYNLQAQGNYARLGQSIPVIYGRVRAFPDFAAMPYGEFSNNEQVLYQLFCIGQGSYDIEAVQIEDQKLVGSIGDDGYWHSSSPFPDITWQLVEPGGTVTLFPAKVLNSDAVGGQDLLTAAPIGPFQIVDDEIDTIGIDLVCSKGLYYANDSGTLDSKTVTIQIFATKLKQSAGAAWVADGTEILLGSETITGKTATALRSSYRYKVGLGRYQVRVNRTDVKDTSSRAAHDCAWTGLRGYVPGVQEYGAITMLAMRMRASDSLSSQATRKVNVICTRKLRTWSPTEGWSIDEMPTRSIAWAFADACRNDQYGGALPDEALPLAQLYAYETGTWKSSTSDGDVFDYSFDRAMTVSEALTHIARAGRASWFQQAMQIRIVRDERRSVPVALYNMRNIVRGSFKLAYALQNDDTTDAVEVTYFDETTWAQSTFDCTPPGFTCDNPAQITLTGVQRRAQAARLGHHTARGSRWRRATGSFQVDREGLMARPGDLVAISHDVPQWGTSCDLTGFSGTGKSLGDLLQLSEAVTFEGAGDHLVSFATRMGGYSGPWRVTAGPEAHQLILAEAVTDSDAVFTPYVGTMRERTRVVFGAADAFAARCVIVPPIRMQSGKVELSFVVDDDRAYDESGVTVPAADSSMSLPMPSKPRVQGLSATFVGTATVPAIDLSWQSEGSPSYFLVEVSEDGAHFTRAGEPSTAAFRISVSMRPTWVRVAAVASLRGDWVTWYGNPATMVGVPTVPTGLAGGFSGADIAVTWSSSIRADFYRIEVWSAGMKVGSYQRSDAAFSYPLSANRADGGPRRSIEIRVYAVNSAGDAPGYAALTLLNAQISTISLTAEDAVGSIAAVTDKPTAADYSGTIFAISQTDGFDPATATPVYSGPNTAFSTGKVTAGIWYVRAAHFDAFGADSLVWSPQVTVKVAAASGTMTVPDASAITAAVGAPPPGGDAFWAVYDTKTKQMARWDSAQGKYVFAVKASDITGSIQQAQLDAALSSRINLIDAPATTAGSVSAQVAAEAAARGAAVTAEQSARQSADSSLAQQITTITAAGTGAFDAVASWGFDASSEGWSEGGTGSALVASGGWIRETSTGVSPFLQSPATSFSGALYPLIRARIRRVSGSGWIGWASYVAGSHGYTTAFLKQVEQPAALTQIGGVAVVEWDMGALTSGGSDWISNTINAFRLSLGASASDAFDIDWIAVGRNAPGASMAGLQAEQTARQSGDTANANSITVLGARLNGGGDIATAIATAQTTANAAVSAGSANANSISSVSARLDSGDIHTGIASVTMIANAAANQANGTAAALSATWQVQVDANGKAARLKAYSTGATTGFLISADKVMIGDLTNLVGSGMGDTLDGWQGNVAALTWGTGSYWLQTAGVASQYALTFRGRDSNYGNWFSVKPGDQFNCSMDTVPNGAGASTYGFSVGLEFYGATGQVLTWSAGATRPAGTVGYAHISGTLTAPVNAAYAKVWVQVDCAGGANLYGIVGAEMHATNIIVRRMNGSELIVDGGITADKLSADAVNAVSVTAQNAVFTKIAAASLSALTGSLGTLNVSGWLYINGDGGSGWGGIRTSGKTWDGDGVDGFVVYRNSGDGSLHLEAKAGNNVLRWTPGNAAINMSSNFVVDNSGTVTLQSASSGARRVMTNSADRYYDASGVLRIEITV